jgi:hypothetical protein
MPALDLMRSMMRGLPADGYEIIRADKKEVYRDAYFFMKLVEAYRSPVLSRLYCRSGKSGRVSGALESSGDRLCQHGRHLRRR